MILIFSWTFLIHSTNPQSRPVVIIVFSHVRPYVHPHFSNIAKQNNRQQLSLLARLWIWPSGSLMTPVSFWNGSVQFIQNQIWTQYTSYSSLNSQKTQKSNHDDLYISELWPKKKIGVSDWVFSAFVLEIFVVVFRAITVMSKLGKKHFKT